VPVEKVTHDGDLRAQKTDKGSKASQAEIKSGAKKKRVGAPATAGGSSQGKRVSRNPSLVQASTWNPGVECTLDQDSKVVCAVQGDGV